jgi:hypothetical protein
MGTRGVWIIELSELDSMTRAEVSRVKAFMSRQVDRIRPPYGRRIMTFSRQCMFAGSTNKEDSESPFIDRCNAAVCRTWQAKTEARILGVAKHHKRTMQLEIELAGNGMTAIKEIPDVCNWTHGRHPVGYEEVAGVNLLFTVGNDIGWNVRIYEPNGNGANRRWNSGARTAGLRWRCFVSSRRS